MKEIGFWDYTCPLHGSLERYTEQDWNMLLDDIAEGGFNSLVLGVKWLTTGYYSRLPGWTRMKLVVPSLRKMPSFCMLFNGHAAWDYAPGFWWWQLSLNPRLSIFLAGITPGMIT